MGGRTLGQVKPQMAFVDSNIIIFANVETYPEYPKALELIERGLKGEFTICFNTITALEAHYKLLRALGADEARYRIRALFESRGTLYFDVSKDTVLKGAELTKKYETDRLRTNDAVIAASMLENNIKTIYTDNEKDFRKILDLKVINPLK